MDAYTTTNIDLATANGSEPIVAPYSKDFMSGVDNFRNVVMPRYCPSCDDRPVRRIASYRNFSLTSDEEKFIELNFPHVDSVDVDECMEASETKVEVMDCLRQREKAYGGGDVKCTWWQKVTGKCKDNASGDGKTGTTGQQVISTLNNIFSWLNTQQQQQANASNYPTPSFDDEKTGLSTGAKIGIGLAVAAVLGVVVYQMVKKPK